MKHVSLTNHHRHTLRSFIGAWHAVRQEGIVSDATEDFHDDEAELPAPTFHNSLNAKGFQAEIQKASTFSHPTNARVNSIARASPQSWQATKIEVKDDDELIPSVWNKLLDHMQDSRNRM